MRIGRRYGEVGRELLAELAAIPSYQTNRMSLRSVEPPNLTVTDQSNEMLFMSQPNKWDLFQNILIGTIAGVIASGVVNRGAIYVFGLASGLWILLIVALKVSKPIFDWVENKENDEDAKDRPYQNAKYAS